MNFMSVSSDVLASANMSHLADGGTDQTQEDFMDKMQTYAIYYVGKLSHFVCLFIHSCIWNTSKHIVINIAFIPSSRCLIIIYSCICIHSNILLLR